MTKKQKQNLIKGILTVVCLAVLALIWFVFPKDEAPSTDGISSQSNQSSIVQDDSQGDGGQKPNDPDNDAPSEAVEFHFIDVGQGDATLIKVGDKNILIDTGDAGARDELFAYLDSHEVTEIEYFVVTHFDSDHFANGTKLLDEYDVKNVIVPEQVKTTKMYETFIAKLDEQVIDGKIEVYNANTMIGEKLNIEDLELTILAPLKNNYKDSNDYSICILAKYGNKKVLLTGDAEKAAEADIVEMYNQSDLDCDVYKMGHHGSRTSSSQGLLDKATPEIVIVSCGLDNKYGHPHKEAMDRVQGLTVYRTDTQGTIVLTIVNDILSFTTEK